MQNNLSGNITMALVIMLSIITISMSSVVSAATKRVGFSRYPTATGKYYHALQDAPATYADVRRHAEAGRLIGGTYQYNTDPLLRRRAGARHFSEIQVPLRKAYPIFFHPHGPIYDRWSKYNLFGYRY